MPTRSARCSTAATYLGTASVGKLPRPATLDEALKAGGLDWDVELVPLMTAEAKPSAVSRRFAVARKDRGPGDPGRVLGVVHPDFLPLQNRSGAELFHSLLDLGEQRYHTGGYLRDGEVVWLLAKLPDEIVVTEGDRLETFLLYSNSHDGSQAIDIRLTTVRVVCRNTLSLALGRNAVHAPFRRAHRHTPRVLRREAEAFFASVKKRIDETQALFRRLHAVPCDDVAFARFLWQLLPDPRPPAGCTGRRPARPGRTRRVSPTSRGRAPRSSTSAATAFPPRTCRRTRRPGGGRSTRSPRGSITRRTSTATATPTRCSGQGTGLSRGRFGGRAPCVHPHQFLHLRTQLRTFHS